MSGKTRPSQRAKVLSNVDYSDLSHTDKKFIHDMFALVEKQQAEIERLNNNISAMATTLSNSAKATRNEAIKECLEWVLSLFPEDKNFTTISRFTVNQKLKEMVGEDK